MRYQQTLITCHLTKFEEMESLRNFKNIIKLSISIERSVQKYFDLPDHYPDPMTQTLAKFSRKIMNIKDLSIEV